MSATASPKRPDVSITPRQAPPVPIEGKGKDQPKPTSRGIYGEATLEDAKALHEEGITVLPLPVLPEDQN